MPDEPGAHNAKAMGVMVRLCKRLHPEIRIYVNPSFWAGFDKDAVASDEVIPRNRPLHRHGSELLGAFRV